MEENIKLFNDSSDEVKLPSVTAEQLQEQQKLRSADITDAISGSTIKTLLLPEETRISDRNFVFDFSDTDKISVFQKEALKSLVTANDGDTSLYLYRKNGLVEFGKGVRHCLERLIPLMRACVFNNEIRVYKDFCVGKPVQEMESRDITKLRLNL